MIRLEIKDTFSILYLGVYSNRAAKAIDALVTYMKVQQFASPDDGKPHLVRFLIRDTLLGPYCWRTTSGECYLIIGLGSSQNREEDLANDFIKEMKDFIYYEDAINKLCSSSVFEDAKVIFNELLLDDHNHSERYMALAGHMFNPFVTAALENLYDEYNGLWLRVREGSKFIKRVDNIKNEIKDLLESEDN